MLREYRWWFVLPVITILAGLLIPCLSHVWRQSNNLQQLRPIIQQYVE